MALRLQAQPTSQANSPSEADNEASSLPDGLKPPSLATAVTVEYPESLRTLADPPGGTVKLRFVVTVDGSVAELSVVESVHPELDALIAEQVRSARFEPATFHGDPVEFVTVLPVTVQPPAPPPPVESDVEPIEAVVEVDDGEPPAATGPVRISGVALESGTRAPLSNIDVVALPAGDLRRGSVSRRKQRALANASESPAWEVRTVTDDEGRFVLRGVPDGRVRLVFVGAEHERLERVVELGANEAIDAKFFLSAAHRSQYRTTVDVDSGHIEDLTRRSVEAEQLAVMPGSNGDALKGVQNLPGAARTPFGIGDILLRGAGPGDSLILVGPHATPLAYHFFGLTSVVPTSMLESVDVIPSAYDARYGDAIGGVVDVRFRRGRTDRVHGEIFADVIQSGAMLEVPIGKGWAMAGVRRSHVGDVLGLANPSFTVAPRYWDYQGAFGVPIGPGELVVRAHGSDDALEGVGDDVDDDYNLQLGSHGVDVEYSGRNGNWSYLVTPGYRFISQDARFAAEDRTELGIHSLRWRAEATWAPKRWVSWQIGTQGDASLYDLNLVSTPLSDDFGTVIDTVRSSSATHAGVYTSATFATDAGFSVTPGFRTTVFALPESSHVVPDPRLRAKWTLPSGTTFKAGGGLYSQFADPALWIEDFGNPRLRPERAWHLSAGMEQALGYGLTAEVSGFLRYAWDLGMPSEASVLEDGESKALNAENTGRGRARGVEVLLKRDFAENLSGWVAYTLSQSELQQRAGEPYRLASWDQTHNLTLIAHWRLPRNWSLGARFRLTSGNLETPLRDGVLDSRTGDYAPIEGELNSERLPMFHQLDLRLDKSWTIRAAVLSAYLDVQNVYNAENAEFYQYSFDYKDRVRVQSLPVLPSLGLNLKF